MEEPFVSDELHGVDLDKRIRRTDKKLAALLGLWAGSPAPHYDLFPQTAKKRMVMAGRGAFHDRARRRTDPRAAEGEQRLRWPSEGGGGGGTLPIAIEETQTARSRAGPLAELRVPALAERDEDEPVAMPSVEARRPRSSTYATRGDAGLSSRALVG